MSSLFGVWGMQVSGPPRIKLTLSSRMGLGTLSIKIQNAEMFSRNMPSLNARRGEGVDQSQRHINSLSVFNGET